MGSMTFISAHGLMAQASLLLDQNVTLPDQRTSNKRRHPDKQTQKWSNWRQERGGFGITAAALLTRAQAPALLPRRRKQTGFLPTLGLAAKTRNEQTIKIFRSDRSGRRLKGNVRQHSNSGESFAARNFGEATVETQINDDLRSGRTLIGRADGLQRHTRARSFSCGRIIRRSTPASTSRTEQLPKGSPGS